MIFGTNVVHCAALAVLGLFMLATGIAGLAGLLEWTLDAIESLGRKK